MTRPKCSTNTNNAGPTKQKAVIWPNVSAGCVSCTYVDLAGSLHCAGCSDINKSCNCLTKHGFGPARTKQTLQTSDRGLDAVDHCCQNYSGLNQDATHVENITVAPAKPWLCAVLIQAPSHASRTSTGGAAEVFCSITAARLQSYFRLFGLGPWHGHCWLKSLSKAFQA